jgi:transcription initiation factor TFIIIB Brf1 subunit/transcription initiation factor TFIIB
MISEQSEDSGDKECTKPWLVALSIEENVPTCPECKAVGLKGDTIFDDWTNGVSVCTECGLQTCTTLISTDREWREFESGEGAEKNRIGGPEDPDVGLSTCIEGEPSALSSKTVEVKDEKSIRKGYEGLEKLCSMLGLASIIVTCAKERYKKVILGHELKRINHDALYVVCIILASRSTGYPRTLREVSMVANVQKRKVNFLFNKIKQQIRREKTSIVNSGKNDNAILSRYCSALKLPQEVLNRTEDIYNLVKTDFQGKNPSTVAAVCIYLAANKCGVKDYVRTLDDISRVTDMKVATIRSLLPEINDREDVKNCFKP